MYTRTQRFGAAGAHSSHGPTDWHALEVQLNRTRTILQEILVHLQEVLKNLKMARNTSSSCGGGSRAEAGSSRFRSQEASRFADSAGSRFRTQTSQQQTSQHNRFERPQPPPHQGPTAAGSAGATSQAGTSERFRAGRTETGFRPDNGASRFRPQAGQEKPQAEGARAGARPGPSASRTTAAGPGASRTNPGPGASRTTTGCGAGGRERPRSENTWRTRTTGQAGPERESRTSHGPTAGPRPGPRPTARPQQQGFAMDGERQRRAREAARTSGMNLKCAYDILCLDYPCSVDEIKVAYRYMARIHHPDLGGDEEAMKDINVAYEMAMRFCAGPRRASAAWAV